MGRKSLAPQRKKEIIKAFIEVAKTNGVNNTSLAMIAKEIDINVSLILHYFTSKDELIIQTCDYMLERYKLIYKDFEEITTLPQLKQFIDSLFTTKWDELVDNRVFFGFYVMIFESEDLRKKFQDLHLKLRDELASIIEKTKTSNITFQENSIQTALCIYDIVDGWFYMSNISIEEKSLEQNAFRCKKMVYNLLGIV